MPDSYCLRSTHYLINPYQPLSNIINPLSYQPIILSTLINPLSYQPLSTLINKHIAMSRLYHIYALYFHVYSIVIFSVVDDVCMYNV